MTLFNLSQQLSQKKWLSVIILVTYYLLIVLPHEKVGVFISSLFEGKSRAFYDQTILALTLLLLSLISYFLHKKLWTHSERKKIIAFLLVHFVLITLSYYYLIIVNIECIHFIQYAALVLLAYPLFKNYTALLILAVLLGVVDEAYQYLYLSPDRTNYYDFNDIILNTLGAGSGILILYIEGLKSTSNKILYWLYLVLSFVCLLILLAFFFNFLTVFSEEEIKHAVALIKVKELNFWSYIEPEIVYHIVRPWEGLILTSILIYFYRLLE